MKSLITKKINKHTHTRKTHMRTSQKDLEQYINTLNKSINLKRINGFRPYYELDCAYDGYKLVVINNKSRGNTEISDRMTAKELYAFIRAYLAGFETAQTKKAYRA